VAARHVGAASGGAAEKVRMARRGGVRVVRGTFVMGRRIRMRRRRRRDDEAAKSYGRGRCVVGSCHQLFFRENMEVKEAS